MRSRWKIPVIYLAGMSLFLLLNYGLLVSAKILAGSSQSVLHSAKRMVDADYHLACGTCCLGIITGKPFYPKGVEAATTGGCIAGRKRHGTHTALQNQLNPHFLFNSLNTLIAEIEYNPPKCGTLHQAPVQCLPLRAAKPGQDTGDARRRTGIYPFVPFSCTRSVWATALRAKTTFLRNMRKRCCRPLTLQLLVENVIKHNSITPGKPMVITIRIEDEYLSVSNPIHPKRASHHPE